MATGGLTENQSHLEGIPECPSDEYAETFHRASVATTIEPAWDPVDPSVEGVDDGAAAESPGFTRAVKLLKIITYLVTFCLVLGSGVISKVTLLLMTSLIDAERTLPVCEKGTELEKDSKYFVKLSVEERWSWVWCILLALFIPEVLTLIRCGRLCIFKKWEWPKISGFLMVVLMESLHVGGVILLLFTVFPKLHVFETLCLTNAVCLIPSLFNIYSYWNTKNTFISIATNFLHIVALIGQLSVIIWLTLNTDRENSLVYIQGGLGTILVSCAWWENYINVNSPSSLLILRKTIEESRNFIYLFVSIWKTALAFALTLATLYLQGNNVSDFLDLPANFLKHTVFIMQPGVDNRTLMDANLTLGIGLKFTDSILLSVERSNIHLPVIVSTIHVAASYLCYSWGKFTCKICIQGFSYALPVFLTVPVAMTLLSEVCDMKCEDQCFLSDALPSVFWKCPSEGVSHFFKEDLGLMWVLWILSQWWLTVHLWKPKCERMASTNKLFVNPLYSTAFIDQSLALNRRKDEKPEGKAGRYTPNRRESRNNNVPQIFACATMWHETQDEMEQLLKSLMRMDAHQCSKRAVRKTLLVKNPDYYEMEAHIFFDDAFVTIEKDGKKFTTINSYVKDLIETVNIAARKIYKNCKTPDPPLKVPTPYGGRLLWKLSGENPLVVHLKNKEKIRHKKRWSQVMYMYYLLGYRLVGKELSNQGLDDLLRNTFVLALDGDIDFKPQAVTLLVDLMKRNKNLGAACGRIHPVGSGLMVYYQKFEYAIGHWLQKSTEHMIGCVLCSPGCFSLFRAEGLVKNNTIRTYASKSKEAIEYVQFDQGEDRWLCTLLLQRGSRVEYSAASDAYTHCPETFAEFYTQRRRWAPSTMANIMDLIVNYKKTVECNENISRPYIAYQILLMVGTILGPGTIFLMLVGAMVTAFKISNWQSFVANLVPIVGFIIICFQAKNSTQILVAQILSALYALLMMAVMVGMSLQLVEDGVTSPTAIFLLSMTASFIVAALAHPQEFWCVAHGLIYFLSVPSMYLLLALYSFINLHVVSWGTREAPSAAQVEQVAAAQQEKSGLMKFLGEHGFQLGSQVEEEGGISFGLANLFRCMCCTHKQTDPMAMHMTQLDARIKEVTTQVTRVQRQIEGSSRGTSFRRRSIHQTDPNLGRLSECEDEASDEGDPPTPPSENFPDPTINQQENDEFWLTDDSLVDSKIKLIGQEENSFWTELIRTYLYPLPNDAEDKVRVTKQLRDLRNTVVFGVLMLNSLFILIVFLLQMQKETLHLEWPLSSRGKANITYIDDLREIRIDLDYLKLEPINLVLVFFFTLILVIQFFGMLFHRLETLSHILASTNIFESKTEETTDLDFTGLAEDLLRKQGLTENNIPTITVQVHEPECDTEKVVFRQGNGDSVLDSVSCVPSSIQASSRISDTASCSGSIVEDRLLHTKRCKFRSLSVALEQDLLNKFKNNPKFRHQARRNSTRPEVLEQIMRTPTQGSVRSRHSSTMEASYQAGIDALDEGFGTPINQRRPMKDDDTISVDSIVQVDDCSSTQPSVRYIFKSRGRLQSDFTSSKSGPTETAVQETQQ